jgi:hypothetical protein
MVTVSSAPLLHIDIDISDMMDVDLKQINHVHDVFNFGF